MMFIRNNLTTMRYNNRASNLWANQSISNCATIYVEGGA